MVAAEPIVAVAFGEESQESRIVATVLTEWQVSKLESFGLALPVLAYRPVMLPWTGQRLPPTACQTSGAVWHSP